MRDPVVSCAVVLASAFSLAFATSASAGLMYQPDGVQIELRDLVARVVVTPEERSDIDIRVRYGKAKVPTLMVSHRGNTTVLNGHVTGEARTMNFRFQINMDDGDESTSTGTVYISGMGKMNIADLPLVYIRVPMNAVVKDSAYSFGRIGTSKSLSLIMNGSGEWGVDPVTGPLNVISSGSGNLRLTTAGDTIIDNMGSGDITLDSVRNLKVSLSGSGNFTANQSLDTDLQNHGSGDVTLSRVRNLNAQLNGSGDLQMNTISGGLTVVNSGSSDVNISRVSGPVTLSLSGSGDVNIDEGQVPAMVIKGSGSGDVNYGGITNTLNIDINGSGDINVGRATGPVVTKVVGSGEMHIGH